MVTQLLTAEVFKNAHREFKEKIGSYGFYEVAIEIKDNYPLQAAIIILATWNGSNFRFIKNKKLSQIPTKLCESLMECRPLFGGIKNENLTSFDFDKNKDTVMKIYETLSEVEGVKYTGASKIMSLMATGLFVMWDGYIRGNKPKKMYGDLPVIKEGLWEYKRYGTKGEDYLQFLKDIQEKVKGIQWDNSEISLAKAIDEFNYVKVTLPIQSIKRPK